MDLDELARSLHAFEKVDFSSFQRHARILQSIWREEQGNECGMHLGQTGSRPLGSRLVMLWAKEKLANFLTENIRRVVREEVLDPQLSAGRASSITCCPASLCASIFLRSCGTWRLAG